MSNTLSNAIQELAPEGLAPANPNSLQEQKSTKMRETILESALDCLAEHGYGNMTHNLICQKAQVSRGALLHHYPSSQDLMVAVIDYAFYKHMLTFSKMVSSLPDESRMDRNTAIALDFQMCQSREMLVYLEMRAVSRTNSELRSIFVPRARHHDLVWKEELLKVFPEWRDDMRKLDLSRRLTRAILEGMIMSRELWRDTEAEWTLVAVTADLLRKIRMSGLEFPSSEHIDACKQAAAANTKASRGAAKKPAVSRPRKKPSA